MGRSWISDRESIQGHFPLVNTVPMDSQDHFGLFGCVIEILTFILVTVIVVYV